MTIKRYTVVRKTYGKYISGFGGGYPGTTERSEEVFADDIDVTSMGAVIFYTVDNKANMNRRSVVKIYTTREIISITPEEL